MEFEHQINRKHDIVNPVVVQIASQIRIIEPQPTANDWNIINVGTVINTIYVIFEARKKTKQMIKRESCEKSCHTEISLAEKRNDFSESRITPRLFSLASSG